MNEHLKSSADLTREHDETQEKLAGIIDLAGEVEKLDKKIGWGDDTAAWVSATYDEAWRKDRLGSVVIRRDPRYEPNAFLEIAYKENGLGDARKETEVIYEFTKANDGDILLQVSDVVSGDPATEALHESVRFAKEYAERGDREIVAAAQDDLDNDAKDALSLERLELAASLKEAGPDDMARLQEILEIAKNGNKHDTEMGGDLWDDDDAGDFSDDGYDERHLSRAKRVARRIGRGIIILLRR